MSVQVLRRTPERGFTLIELVVVIVILGILAAFAIPRFANIASDARASAINGMAGTLRSTAALVHGMALARNVTNGSVTLENQAVTIVNGYPAATALGIEVAMANVDTATFDITHAAGVTTVKVKTAPSSGANCKVTYTEAPANGTAVVSGLDTTAC